ncbi:hypothetical protein CKO35_11050 [Ectothiorhodospira shaposhnikovii]|uniref:DUF4389 domain-containing protein n=1 Tax=Ectothiorhodospira shaposhnikovii TaxID=1054 RepID=UPI001907E6D2|nr:DUF4389 domain-containing protein [Ectothiorhodospira shaposhnikovii]MBK1673833.1 hypothetical protein [Ectothiorhodospira shaposhnikovii]
MESSPSNEETVRPMPRNLWVHGLIMLVLLLLVNLAQTILGICAILQFFWMLVNKERNEAIARFGEGAARWLSTTARFLTGRSDERPFPWAPW